MLYSFSHWDPPHEGRVTVTFPDGTTAIVIPDAIAYGSTTPTTYIEFKDVVNIQNSPQFDRYGALNSPIRLIVSPNTQTIAPSVQAMVNESNGSIQVFDPVTNTLTNWVPK